MKCTRIPRDSKTIAVNHQKVSFFGFQDSILWGLVPSDGKNSNFQTYRPEAKMACDMEVEIVGRNCMEMTDSMAQMSYSNCFSQRGSLSQSTFMAATLCKNAGKRETFNNRYNGLRPEVAGGKRKYESEKGHQSASSGGSNTDCNSLSYNRGPTKKVLTYYEFI